MNDIVAIIRAECSEILEFYRNGGGLLYRGSKDKPSIFRRDVRQDRIPANTPEAIHHATDEALTALGFTAIRSNSLFVTSKPNIAGFYGPAYVILPMNGFAFTYWRNAQDFFAHLNAVIEAAGWDGIDSLLFGDEEAMAWAVDNIARIVDAAEPAADGLDDAVKSGNEIMVASPSYWAIGIEEWEGLREALCKRKGA